MSSVSDNLFKALQTGESLYDSFLRTCRENLPANVDDRYSWLRSNGFVARDEKDISVYVTKVATKHWPKFRWLYDNLFINYPKVFQGELDLVVWGCGCGLDLLALYDRAMQQENPQLWLSVRSVTLVDISDVALNMAEDIAELLFPAAQGRIVKCKCDLIGGARFNVKIPPSFLYTTRLHLISNVLDLFSDSENVSKFTRRILQTVGRVYETDGKQLSYYNDIWVAFSPEYGRYERVAENMAAFRTVWSDYRLASPLKQVGGGPERCAYVAFGTVTPKHTFGFKAYLNGNRALRGLVRGFNRYLNAGGNDDGRMLHLINRLVDIKARGKSFVECFEWVDVQYYSSMYDVALDRIVFVPNASESIVPCIIKIGWFSGNENDRRNEKRHAVEKLLENYGHDSESASCLSKTRFEVFAWYENDVWASSVAKYSEKLVDWNASGQNLFADLFIIDPKGAEPLPDLDEKMNGKQRKIILDRRQLRKIRGGAGCGKTTTMLWHGVMAILRMHQPVLLACRTVTLFSHNQRRMAATLLDKVPGLEYVTRDLIRFMTIDKYLCEYIDVHLGCDIKLCGKCKREFHDDHKKFPEQWPRVKCVGDVAKARLCEIVKYHPHDSHRIVADLTKIEKDGFCKLCKDSAIKAFCKNDMRYLRDAEPYGAVLVDEIQSVEPEKVQALYNLTAAGNPRREFYVFCDERQCLKSESLESDPDVLKFRVKAPKTSGGSRFNAQWFSLNKPYRQIGDLSGQLLKVAAAFQGLTDDKYGADEVERQPYQPSLANVFSVDSVSQAELFDAIHRRIKAVKSAGISKKITILCDNSNTVYGLLGSKLGYEWLSTHAIGASFKKEQQLRNDFEESESHIGLTTIELAQGWDLDCVILIVTRNRDRTDNMVESIFTGITRAKNELRILDASPTHWVYRELKRFN